MKTIGIIAVAALMGACTIGPEPGSPEYGTLNGVKQSCFNTTIGFHVPAYEGAAHCKEVHAAFARGDMKTVYNYDITQGSGGTSGNPVGAGSISPGAQ